MQIIDGKALLLKLRNPKRVTETVPKSREVRDNEVLVNWGIDEMHTLKRLNINVPSPIQSQYTWTGKYAPFDHQKKTSAFLTMNRKSFCFNEQGTGKTASAIWAADFLLRSIAFWLSAHCQSWTLRGVKTCLRLPHIAV
jgi:hypothetical protein